MNELLEYQLYDNSTTEWAIAGAIAAVVFVALWALRWLVARRFAGFAEHSRFTFDDVIVATLKSTRIWMLVLIAAWAGSLALTMPEELRDRLGTLVKLALILQAAFWGNAAIGAWVSAYTTRRADSDPSGVTTMRAVGVMGRLALWAVLLLSALASLGINVTGLVAGLGIGGIAVALAVQNILGDLFASLSIVLDKPFVIGDFIIVGDHIGTVENIGLKTTRVRSLSGEQLVFSNSDLLNSRIRNFKRMFERRVVFTVGVTYQTPREKLVQIPIRIREIIEAQEDTRFDRSHFKSYGASSIDFETVFYVKLPDYNVYMDRQQTINLAIHEYFESAGIDFAYPTQTIFLEGGAAPDARETTTGTSGVPS